MMKVSNQLCSTILQHVFRSLHQILPGNFEMSTEQHGKNRTQTEKEQNKNQTTVKKTRPDYFLSLQKVPAKQDSSNKLQDSSNKLLHGVFPTFPPSNNPQKLLIILFCFAFYFPFSLLYSKIFKITLNLPQWSLPVIFVVTEYFGYESPVPQVDHIVLTKLRQPC